MFVHGGIEWCTLLKEGVLITPGCSSTAFCEPTLQDLLARPQLDADAFKIVIWAKHKGVKIQVFTGEHRTIVQQADRRQEGIQVWGLLSSSRPISSWFQGSSESSSNPPDLHPQSQQLLTDEVTLVLLYCRWGGLQGPWPFPWRSFCGTPFPETRSFKNRLALTDSLVVRISLDIVIIILNFILLIEDVNKSGFSWEPLSCLTKMTLPSLVYSLPLCLSSQICAGGFPWSSTGSIRWLSCGYEFGELFSIHTAQGTRAGKGTSFETDPLRYICPSYSDVSSWHVRTASLCARHLWWPVLSDAPPFWRSGLSVWRQRCPGSGHSPCGLERRPVHGSVEVIVQSEEGWLQSSPRTDDLHVTICRGVMQTACSPRCHFCSDPPYKTEIIMNKHCS